MNVFNRLSLHPSLTKWARLHERIPFRFRQRVHNFGSGR
jgi:hypothetical protein